MRSATESIATYLDLRPTDRILNLSPLAFDYGLYNVFLAFRAGGTLILEQPFISPHQLFRPLRHERVTGLPLVPTTIAMLLSLARLERYDTSRVRYVTTTGQPLPPAHSRRLVALFPNAEIYSMYGLTECKRVSYLPPEQLAERPTSVGKAMLNTEAFLVDDQGHRIDEPHRTGELVIRGSHVMLGYWNRPEATAKVLQDGPLPGSRLLYSGDLFQQDEEGYLYFVRRRDELIKSGGERISPREIEAVVAELPQVTEVAAIGVDDPILGRAVELRAVLEPTAELTAASILAHCEQHLERSRVPRRIEILKQLPRTPSGKLDRRALERLGRSEEIGR